MCKAIVLAAAAALLARPCFPVDAPVPPPVTVTGQMAASTSLAPTGALTGAASASTNLTYLPGAHWPVGERLVYRIYWGIIPVGLAVTTTDWLEEDGRRLLRIRFRTKSNRVLETVYPVDDSIVSIIDPDTFLPIRFEKNLSEGSHRYHEVTVFDRTNNVAHWESKLTGRTKSFPIRPDTRDIPSFMYYMRSHKFQPGTREHFEVMADEKTYDLWINVTALESTQIPVYGAVECIKAEPEAAFNGLFVRDKGQMWIWVSHDERCLATRVAVQIPVAKAKIILEEVQGPGDDAWIRKAREYRAKNGPGPEVSLGL